MITKALLVHTYNKRKESYLHIFKQQIVKYGKIVCQNPNELRLIGFKMLNWFEFGPYVDLLRTTKKMN